MKLNFRKVGEGPPLLILHGLLGSLDNWTTLAKRFGEHFSVYLVDQRNHGQSPHSSGMDFDVMAGDVLSLMEDAGIAWAHVIGHSMGGKVAMRFAVLHPGRVGKLVIVDIAPRLYPPGHENIFRGLFAIDLARAESRLEVDQLLTKHVPDVSTRQFLLKNLTRDENGHLRWRANLDGIYTSYDQLNASTVPSQPYRGEILFVRGGRSRYITEADLREIPRSFPKAQFATVEDAGHWVHADAPERLREVVLSFLLAAPNS
jgi:pimeloyl-ACP methyl ester carboxylesterase